VKSIKKLTIVFFLLSIGITQSFAVEFSLKIAGGISFLKPEEVNQVLIGWEEYWITIAGQASKWTYLGGEVSPLNLGYEFEVELIFSMTSRFALGLSSGYIFSDVNEENTSLTIEKVLGTFTHVKPTKISAIPLILSGYYIQPINSSLSLFFRAGGGPIWAKYFERDGTKRIDVESYSYPESISSSAQGQIYLLGLGVVFKTESGIRFFMEGSWRKANISGFSGENKNEETGALTYVEEYNSVLDLWQAKYLISSEPPEDENYRSVRQGTIDLSGFSVKIGIMIQF
jgi:hypothetical protein